MKGEINIKNFKTISHIGSITILSIAIFSAIMNEPLFFDKLKLMFVGLLAWAAFILYNKKMKNKYYPNQEIIIVYDNGGYQKINVDKYEFRNNLIYGRIVESNLRDDHPGKKVCYKDNEELKIKKVGTVV